MHKSVLKVKHLHGHERYLTSYCSSLLYLPPCGTLLSPKMKFTPPQI